MSITTCCSANGAILHIQGTSAPSLFYATARKNSREPRPVILMGDVECGMFFETEDARYELRRIEGDDTITIILKMGD